MQAQTQDTDLMPTLAEASIALPLQEVPAELEERSTLERVKAADEAREGFPGEHWIVLGLGIAIWQFTRKNRNWLVRSAGAFAATGLVARAASGREGLAKVLRYTPLGRGIRI